MRFAILLILSLWCVSKPIQANEKMNAGVRLGLSNVSGLIALELQGSKLMGSVGWMPAFGDGAESLFNPLRIAVALRAKLKKTGHGPVLNASFMTKYSAYAFGSKVKSFPFLSASAGYRILVSGKADVILSGGIGFSLGVDELGKASGIKRLWPAIDLTVGLMP